MQMDNLESRVALECKEGQYCPGPGTLCVLVAVCSGPQLSPPEPPQPSDFLQRSRVRALQGYVGGWAVTSVSAADAALLPNVQRIGLELDPA